MTLMAILLKFHVDQMMLTNESISFAPGQVLKHSRRGRKMDIFTEHTTLTKNSALLIV